MTKHPPTLSMLLTLYIGGGLLVLALVLGGLLQFGIGRVLDEALRNKADALARQLATVSVDAILIYDYGTLERYIWDLARQPDILYLRIRRRDGEILAEAGLPPGEAKDPDRVTITRPVPLGTDRIGDITVGYDRGSVRASILHLSAAVLAGVLLLILLLYFVLKVLLDRHLVRPVQALAARASPLRHSATDGRLRSPDPAHLPDELARIARAFERLCREIDGYGRENERIQRLARKATERLCHEQRLASVGQMAAQVAHGLNTPLGNILGYAQQAKRVTQDHKLLRRLTVIEEQTRVCSATVRNLLTAARPPEAHPRSITLHGRLEGTLSLIEPVLRDRGIETIELSGDPELQVWADPACVEQVLFNLSSNAADAGATEMQLYIQGQGKLGVLTVRDNGAGVPEKLKARLFEPFVTDKPPGVGTGLGLHICKTLLHSVGAEFDLLESHPGTTVFRIAWRLSAPVQRGVSRD